jgi:excisionase family DNA binding protein
VEQAAVYLGRSVEAVRSLLKRGALPVVRTDSRVMFDIQDLDSWISQNKAGQ